MDDIARTYNWSTSTICTILENKDIIEEIQASKGYTQLLDDVERLLLIRMHEKQLRGDNFNEKIICEKVTVIFADIVKKMPGSSTAKKVF
ncbi:hypothetical protein AVEN_53699-1 [Araneus ventricosus]|uniref:HTH psq-type domain-containing protein n=1 Tax=Araneus ventricosus TaxID=182803 RepID=A0A4Y2UQ65_ARAVE|nr:hypothetical protein AVEN_53699-1 [Araneus ventricosus]